LDGYLVKWFWLFREFGSQGVPGEFINVTIAYMVTNKEWKWKALSHLLPMQEHYFGRS
jgi:hypothetical protein